MSDGARVNRARDVLLRSEIRATETAGTFLVQSCKDSNVYYKASGLFCTCPDAQRHPGPICKHSAAVAVRCAASQLAS